jgi:hypothetical protein
MSRKLTARERKSIERLERALKSMPATLTLFFEGNGVYVYDVSSFNELANGGHGSEDQEHIVHSIKPSCSFDAGGF